MNANSKTSSHKNNQPHLRRSVLATASVLALGGFLATGAMAQITTSYTANAPTVAPVLPLPLASTFGQQTLLPGAPMTYTDWITNQQDQQGTLLGTVSSGPTPPGAATQIGVTYLAAPALPAAPTPVTVNDNYIRALAEGNVVVDAIDMAALDHGTPRPGLIILSGQMNSPEPGGTGLGTVSAVVAPALGSKIFVLEANQVAAPITLNTNSITATATQNSSDNSITGVVPVKTPPLVGETGSITAGYNDAGFANQIHSNTQGTVNIVNQQTVLQAGPVAGSGARVGDASVPAAGARVSLDVSKTIDGTTGLPADIGTALTVDGNRIAAAYTGNTTTNTFRAASGSADFTGSVVVSNGQAIIEGNMGVPVAAGTVTSALVTDSSVSADIRQRTTGSETDLTGTLSTSNNAITAASTGSRADNQLQFSGLVNLTGTGSTTTNSLQNLTMGNAVSLQSDLALFSGQANSSTALESVVDTGTVSVKADNVSGTISTNSNRVVATSVGNVAGNLLGVNATNFAATAAAGNLQTNAGTPITATNTSGAVTVGVGLGGNNVTGTVSVNQNVLGAAAEGNVANTRLALDATTATALASTGAPSVTADTQNGAGGNWGQAVATSGLSATNLQGNYYGVINASATDNVVQANFVDQTSAVAALPSNLVGADVTVNNNLIQAFAAGSSATTAVALAAGNPASVQAAVGNTQFNASTVTANVGQSMVDTGNFDVSGVSLTAGNVSGSSNLTVSNNTLDATVLVNSAANSLTGQVGNVLAVTPTGFASVSANVTAGATAAVSNAAFGIASSQLNTATTKALNETWGDVTAGVVLGTVANSVVSVNGNDVIAANTANKVANNLALTVGNNAQTLGGAAGPIAGISNLQVNAVAAGATEPASLATVFSDTSLNFLTSATNATLSLNGNTETAKAKGNTAERFLVNGVLTGGNTLSASGTNLSSPPAGATTGTIYSGIPTLAIQNEFALLNKQNDDVAATTFTPVLGGGTPDFNFAGVNRPSGFTAPDYVIGRYAEANTNNAIFRSDMGVVSPTALITGSTLSLVGNETLAETGNNAAYNNLELNFTVLKSGAGLLNQQESSTAAAANALSINAIYSRDTFTTDTTLTANENKVMALVKGSDASNTLRVTGSTTLTGNAALDGTRDANTAATASADFGLVNNQRQTGDLTAYTRGIVAIDLPGIASLATITDSSATVKFNEISATAQATGATNNMVLSAGDMNGVSGALGSTQFTAGSVRAFQGSASATFMVSDGTATDTPITVSNNTALAKAGQNQATNNQYVLANTLTGRVGGGGTLEANASTANPPTAAAGGVLANTDFSVVNVQSGATSGDTAFVGALSQGNLVGSEVIQFIGGQTRPSLAIDDNTVRAEGTFNRATNTQVLAGGVLTAADGSQTLVSATTVNATGAVVNAQTSAGTGNARVDSVQVGTARAAALTSDNLAGTVRTNEFSPVGMEVMTNAETTVSRNKLQAQIDGNVSSNALWVDASTSIASSPAGTNPALVATFAVRNAQSSSATLTAGVTRADVGVFMENIDGTPRTYALPAGTLTNPGSIDAITGAITNSNVTVSGNNAEALGTANTQTSRLNVKSAGTIGDTTNPSTYTVQNDQGNTGAVTAKVGGDARLSVNVDVGVPAGDWAGGLDGGNVNIGIKAVGAISGSMNVSDNTKTALANGNTSFASEISVSGGNSVYTPVQNVWTTQTNSGALTSTVEGYGAAQTDPGTLGVGIQAGTTLGGQNTVNGNKLTAGVAGNTALSNVASTVTDGTVYDPTVDVNNAQTNAAALQARVLREAVGIKAGTITAGANTVNGNFQTAQAYGNTAGTNGINMAADNILAYGTPPALFNVTNTQTNTVAGALTAEVVTGTIGIQAAGSVAPAAVGPASITDSASTVSGNKLTAVVGGNTSAANTVTLTGQNTISNPQSNVLNTQTNAGALLANVTTGSVGIRAGSAAGEAITGGTSTVNGNNLVAQGQANLSESNAITASAPNITAPLFKVVNTQDNVATGDVTSAVTGGSVGINTGLATTVPAVSAIPALTLLTGSNTTVSGNTLSASAEGNKALSNAITVSGTTILNAGATVTGPNYQVLNGQTNRASTSARLTGSDVGVNATTVASLNASVSDNLLIAKAGGNWANANKISVTADNSITGSGLAAIPTPTLYVQNEQDNIAGAGAESVQATVGDARVGILNTGTFTNVNASVLSNQIVAYGYGNWASNGITLSQLPGNTSQATAGISNQQLNSQSITSVVYNVNIGLGNGAGSPTGGTSGGFATVSGNGVTAQALGNYASNRIGVK